MIGPPGRAGSQPRDDTAKWALQDRSRRTTGRRMHMTLQRKQTNLHTPASMLRPNAESWRDGAPLVVPQYWCNPPSKLAAVFRTASIHEVQSDPQALQPAERQCSASADMCAPRRRSLRKLAHELWRMQKQEHFGISTLLIGDIESPQLVQPPWPACPSIDARISC